MRIVGGRWRKRRIDWPDTGVTRPITDRVREAVFDILGCRLGTPGELPPLRVADVFCGGGSLGLEALSRGAASACFFDRDRDVVRVLRRNLQHLEVGPEGMVVVSDVYRDGLKGQEPYVPFELIFVDPPFRDARDTSSRSVVTTLLRRFGSARSVAAAPLLVLRHEQKVRFPEVIAKHWRQDDRREYGKSAVTFLVRATPQAAEAVQPADDSTEDQDPHGIA